MKLHQVSKDKFDATFKLWRVIPDFSDPIYRYLVYGFDPGSFFCSVLANDFMTAMVRSHPGNTTASLKALVGWINDCMPFEAYGSYDKVKAWTSRSEDERRAILEDNDLIYKAKEETWLAIKGEPA